MTETLTEPTAARAGSLREQQRDRLFPCVATYYPESLVLDRAEGVWVWDVEGREYLDLFAGILTTSVGHCHPEVVAAADAQARRLGHTSSLYVTEGQVEVARRLDELSPGALRCSFFTNSGTEAIETAVLLACMHTGRTEVIGLRHAYHGRSTLATNLTAHSAWRPLTTTIAGIKHVAAPYPYRAPFAYSSEEELVDYYMRDLEEAIQTTTSGKPAAFVAETILGVGGYVVPPAGYFQRAAEIIRAYGGLFICDEVQAGFGRTGDRWFGIEHWEVEPDIMVMAKGIANGYPVGATITRNEIAASWTAKTISTYGGNPVSMAAAAAAIDVMRREDAPANAAQRGQQLRQGLDGLYERHAWIGEVRGMGLIQALEVVEDRESKTPDPARAAALLDAAREEGVLVGLGGLKGHVVRCGPSLLITEAEIDEAVARLARACERADG